MVVGKQTLGGWGWAREGQDFSSGVASDWAEGAMCHCAFDLG